MRDLLADLITVVIVLIPMTLCAAGVATLAYLGGRADVWPWYAWLIAAPLLYMCWLLLFLLTSALICQQLGKRYPKPRYRAFRPGERIQGGDLGLITALVCYRRAAMIMSLPLVPVLEQSMWVRKLVLHAYSPSIHVGTALTNWGNIYDPDLTEIGDNVVVGGRAAIVAHSMAMRGDGQTVYISAPVRIGDRATIGGEARVALGCVIEDDAVVEPGSVVAPFTRVPTGEVWGGNPACFRRLRDDVELPEIADPARIQTRRQDLTVRVPAGPSSRGSNGSGTSGDEIRQLVLAALDLAPDQAPAHLDSTTCPSWDSLGQIAIAAAVFDRYGVSVNDSDVYRIRTFEDVADVVRFGRISTPEAPPPQEDGLPDDLEMLPLLDSQEASRALAERFHGGPPGARRIPIVVAATFTAQPLATSLKLWGRAFGFEFDCEFAGNDQLVPTLLADSGPFASNPSGINLVLTRPEDLASNPDQPGTDRVEHVLKALERFASTRAAAGQLLVGTLPPLVSVFTSADRERVEELRHRWRTGLEATPGITLFDFARVVERVGVEAARASGTEVLMRAPYSPRLYQELGIALIRQIRASRHAPAKVVAVDCDNTLWGGVVGEVGLEGIELGPDGTGRSYQLFQSYLKQLKARGQLLVVVSKNEEHDVRLVFERHPEMILRCDDIAAWRVNWRSKSQNLRELADQLNLALDSFVFIDDDPAVRLEVKTRLQEAHVVPLPEDPAGYCDALDRLWLFDGAEATAVDAARTRLVQEEQHRRREYETGVSFEDFLSNLELRVEVSPPREAEWARVAQLTQRTNQFNLSLKRRTLQELQAISREASVMVLRAADRFGDYGLVGVGIIRSSDQAKVAEIDTLVLSCRALGRGVEEAFLHALASLAGRRGAQTLVAPFLAGPRNAQVPAFLLRAGFVETAPGNWTLALTTIPAWPPHVQFHLQAGSQDMYSSV